MIQLHSDCLVFETKAGELIPCSAEALTIELVHKVSPAIDPTLLQEASAAVSHYFQHELKRTCIGVAEFADALAVVLRKLGSNVELKTEETKPTEVKELNLARIAAECCTTNYELAFFQQLRERTESALREAPELLHIKDLRRCVKQLTGSKRWTRRCRQLRDQIVDYVRACWAGAARSTETAGRCGLLIH